MTWYWRFSTSLLKTKASGLGLVDSVEWLIYAVTDWSFINQPAWWFTGWATWSCLAAQTRFLGKGGMKAAGSARGKRKNLCIPPCHPAHKRLFPGLQNEWHMTRADYAARVSKVLRLRFYRDINAFSTTILPAGMHFFTFPAPFLWRAHKLLL